MLEPDDTLKSGPWPSRAAVEFRARAIIQQQELWRQEQS